MHGTIYQITTVPVEIDDYISEYDFYEHWFVGSIADYVAGDLNRGYELSCFRKSLENIGVATFTDDESFTILPNGKTTWFQGQHKGFIAAAKKASELRLEEFSSVGDNDMLVFEIQSSFCDEFGPYVSSEEFDTIPLDKFIRNCKPGEKYYIGGVLDYHW